MVEGVQISGVVETLEGLYFTLDDGTLEMSGAAFRSDDTEVIKQLKRISEKPQRVTLYGAIEDDGQGQGGFHLRVKTLQTSLSP
jgi:hypothetical protein